MLLVYINAGNLSGGGEIGIMGFKRKRGASNRRMEGMPHGCGEKERRIVVFRKVRLVQEASAAGGNYYVSPPPPLAHPPSPIPPTHTCIPANLI